MEINVINMKEINDVLYLYKCQGKPIVIDDKVTLQKEKVKNIDQNRQNIFKTRLEKYNSRINQIQKQNVINKAKKAEVSLQREKRIKNKLSDLKSQEYQKNLKLIQSIKDKEIKSQKLLAERKHLMLSKNQDLRKKTFSGNKGFLNKSKNQFSEHEEEINDEPLKEENEEECFIHSDQSKSEAIHFQKFDYLRVYLERINKFKKNFGSCEAGRYFLGKTAPIWDSLTQCIYRKSLILSDMTKESEDTTPEAYRKLYEETDNNVTMKSQASRAANKKFWLLETLNMDLDYEISESDVYRALDKAKSLNDESATAFEIMDLVKCILEHEADVSYNVRYVCNGLLRRTAFEHVKRRTNHQILRRSQNTINRLWEKIDSIPKQQLASENRKKLVEPIIYAFTADPSPHGDTAVSVDPAAAYANRVRMAMRDFSKTTCSSGGGGATSMLIDCEDKGYEMPQKNYVEKHVDKQVDRLMGFVGKRLGSNLMKRSFALVRDPPGYQLAANKFLVLARKMTKIVFDMDYTREEQIYVLDVIMISIPHRIFVLQSVDPATGFRVRYDDEDLGTSTADPERRQLYYTMTNNASATAVESETAKERVRVILEEGCDVSVDKTRPKELPEWFDEKMFDRGKKYFYANFYAMFVSKLMGLILVLTVPTILDVLILTNKSSDPYNAFRRYLDTIRHMVRWYNYDLKNTRSKSRKSVTIVHGLHCAASRTSEKAGLGLRVSQKDMSLTQFGFIGLLLLKKKELAIIGTEEDERSIVHFWRTIGYLLGIQDKFNLCHGTLDEVRGVCAVILKDYYAPALRKPTAQFNQMVAALIDGMKPISPMLDLDAFMTYLNETCGVTDAEKRLSTRYSRCMYNIQTYTHDVLLTNKWLAFVFRPLLNYNMRFSVWINIKFPFGAAFKFGTKVFSRVQEAPHPVPAVHTT